MSLRGPKHLRVIERPLGVPGHTAFPQKLFKRFETYNVFYGSASGASHQWNIRANSCFDPMGGLAAPSAITSVYGSISSQPRGWDQWTAFYASYYVYAARLDITARVLNSASYKYARKIGIYVSNAATSLSRFELDERGITNHFYDLEANSSIPVGGSNAVLRVSRGAHTTDVLQGDNPSEVSAAVGAAPSKLWYICIRDEDIALDVLSSSALYDIKLTQWVKLFDPIAPAAS